MSVDVGRGVARDADGRRGVITYADTDIVVWNCPACEFTNADTLA